MKRVGEIMNKKWKIAIVGGHGLVAKHIIKDLFDLEFPMESLTLYGSKEHAHTPIKIQKEIYPITPLSHKTIQDFDLVFFSGNDHISEEYASDFIKKGALVIDNSSFFRMHHDVPLVIPEINKDDLLDGKNLFANPNCTTIMILLALKSLHERYQLEKVFITSYQSASGAGKDALKELLEEQKDATYTPKILPSSNASKKVLADNILPVVDSFLDNGYTREEMKIRAETQKIFHDNKLEINVTCVRVPTTIGHGASIAAQFKEKVDVDEALKLWKDCPYLKVFINPNYPSLLEVRKTPIVGVGRLRKDLDCEYTLNFFVTSDNLIRGASYNAVMMAFKLWEIKNNALL